MKDVKMLGVVDWFARTLGRMADVCDILCSLRTGKVRDDALLAFQAAVDSAPLEPMTSLRVSNQNPEKIAKVTGKTPSGKYLNIEVDGQRMRAVINLGKLGALSHGNIVGSKMRLSRQDLGRMLEIEEWLEKAGRLPAK